MRHKHIYLHLLILAILTVFVFRQFFSKFSVSLLDWYDYPLYSWSISGNIEKIKTGQILTFFNRNTFYPRSNAYLLSDTLIPQSLLALPFSYLNTSPIFLMNTALVITIFLNLVSSYLLFLLITKSHESALFGSVATSFSPFFHSQISHFQMVSFWPFLLCIFIYLKRQSNKFVGIFLSSLLISIQFLSSVYLSVFLVFTLLVISLVHKRLANFTKVFVVSLIFLLPILLAYISVQKTFDIKRDYGEYVTYSAHLTDFVFTDKIYSPIYTSIPYIQKWNNFNKHTVGEVAPFPGFVLSLLTLLYFIKVKRGKNNFSINFSVEKPGITYLILAITGLVFALGPRLNVNGVYTGIPLPYHFVVKYIPFAQIVRSTARWAFLFYFALVFFAAEYLKNRKKIFVKYLLIAAVIAELIPISLYPTTQRYIFPRDESLQKACSYGSVVLHYPVTHLNTQVGVVQGLNYISKIQLSTQFSKCSIVNGYSGYDFPDLVKLGENIKNSFSETMASNIINLTKEYKAEYFVVNKYTLSEKEATDYNNTKSQLTKYLTFTDEYSDIYHF